MDNGGSEAGMSQYNTFLKYLYYFSDDALVSRKAANSSVGKHQKTGWGSMWCLMMEDESRGTGPA